MAEWRWEGRRGGMVEWGRRTGGWWEVGDGGYECVVCGGGEGWGIMLG